MANVQQEPQYIMSALNTPMLNYKVYVMNKTEKLVTFLLAFVSGGAVGLVFYGGQFTDEDGAATLATLISNIVIFVVVGLIANKVFYPIRIKQLHDKRKTELTNQFRSFLEAIAVSLSSGMNMTDALSNANSDLKMQFSEDAYIVAEVNEMINGLQNNVQIEEMLMSFGERSEIEDIKNFSTVFAVAYRAGGNIKDIVRRTNQIISEKIEISQEIETALSSNKTQFSAMMVIPVVMMILLRTMSSSFAKSFSTVAGVIAITIAIGMFVGAYFLGQKIMDIGE